LSTKETRSESYCYLTHQNYHFLLESAATETTSCDLPTTKNVHPETTHVTSKPSISTTHYEDKKYNIVMYGIKKCPSKTDRLENDLQSITKLFSNVELPIQANSIYSYPHNSQKSKMFRN